MRIAGILSLVWLLACGDEAETDDSLREDVEAFAVEHNERALDVCGATEEQVADDAPESDAANCYFELAFSVDDCALDALEAHPKEGRAYFDCTKQDYDELIACCQDGAACSYARVETCYVTLWDGETSSTCEDDIDLSEIEAQTEECRR